MDAAPPPELHVLLAPELLSDILEAFIEFFAGVAVPSLADMTMVSTMALSVVKEDEAGRAAARAAAVEAGVVGAALPAPSPNLVFAALQVPA